MRPTTMILGADNRKPWSKQDVLIMQAYQIIQDERCAQCGMPRYLCRNADPRLQVRIKVDDCYAKQEIDKWQENHKDDKGNGAVYPEFYTTDGSPLSDYRASYYRDLAQERAEEQAAESED